MIRLSRPRRARRSHEWNDRSTVTFIVTLAASRSVTLAARSAGMSRKAAYALRHRDPSFDAAWNAALNAGEGDKVQEVEGAPVSPLKGNKRAANWPSWSAELLEFRRPLEDLRGDAFFDRLIQKQRHPDAQPVDK